MAVVILKTPAFSYGVKKISVAMKMQKLHSRFWMKTVCFRNVGHFSGFSRHATLQMMRLAQVARFFKSGLHCK